MGRLGYDRVKAILRSLNIYRDKRLLRGLFSALDVHAAGTLAFDQVVQVRSMLAATSCLASNYARPYAQLVDMLRDRPDIAGVFARLASLAPASGATDEGASDSSSAMAAPTPTSSHLPQGVVVSASDAMPGASPLASAAAIAGAASIAAHTALLPVAAFLQFLQEQQVGLSVCSAQRA